MKRKPKQTKITAYETLNIFLKQNDIVLGLDKPRISFTDTNQIVISPSKVIAIYRSDLKKENKNA